MEPPENTTFAFTDGSCLTNPGPCGAGAVLYPPYLEPVPLKKPVCKTGSILLGELVAVHIALEHFLQYLDISHSKLLKIFSDSQSTVGVLTLNWKESCYKDITTEIRQTITTLHQKGADMEIAWTPGYASIVGNERGLQEDIYIQMGQLRTWQSISLASNESGLQKVLGYPQQEGLLSDPTTTDRIFKAK